MTWRQWMPRVSFRAGRVDLIERRAFKCYMTKWIR